ncbi:MAG: HlyD family efflux transporter periplasmic adaptor subunit [Bacteroidota bacterium]
MEDQVMMEEHERIELRSEEVQEILGTPPRWIVRWGTTVAFISIALMAVVSYIIKYPDVIRAPVVLTTAIPPESVIAKTDAQILELLVEDKDPVNEGELLVILQSTANYDDVIRLDSQMLELQTIEDEDPELISYYQPDKSLLIGDIQQDYSSFIEDYEEYIFSINSDYDQVNTQQLRNQIKKLQQSIEIQDARLKNASEELDLERKSFKSLQSLYGKGTTLEQLREARKKVVAKESNVKFIKGIIVNNRLEIEKINEEILKISQRTEELTSNRYVRLMEGIKRLRSRIDKWKQTHLMYAPKGGYVSYPTFGREKRFVKAGEEVMAVVPEQQDSIVGKVLLPIAGSGKVLENQKVIIKFDSYPYLEYGSVRGKVVSKSLLPKDNQYLVEISLDNGLRTSYKKDLSFDQEMQGLAEIITEDRRFIERIFDKFLALFNDY